MKVLYNLNKENTTYNFINIISGDNDTISGIYPDDTNLTILNKICVHFYNVSANEIFACTSDYRPIGFNYSDPSILIEKIINKKKLDIRDFSDDNFIDSIGNRKNVLINNVLHELFENNFPVKDIYYFSLKELLTEYSKLYKKDMDDSFIYQVIYKYFPNIQKLYLTEYDSKENSDLRKSNFNKIKELITNNNKLIKILNDNEKNILNEINFNLKLIKLNFIPKEENYINIIKLFSDFPLSSENLITKLILGEYDQTYFKIYKPELKLKLSDESKILDKDICNRLIKDYKDNINIPLNLGYIPTFEQPKNCIIIKSYLSDFNLYYSFILFKEGNIDLVINNYYETDIDDSIINKIIDKANELINRINKYRISTKIIIPNINYLINPKPNLYVPVMQFMNCNISFSMSEFSNNKGVSKYLKKNILIFLGNFYTHFRIMKEKMDLHLDNDDILVHYKRVNNYENMDVIQSIINVLYDPQAQLEPAEFIELIHERTSLSIDDATREYKKWKAHRSVDATDNKKFSIQTKETGSEIIINKYLDEYIRFQIFNVQSLPELNRIILFIKIFMKLYSLFVSDKLNSSLKSLFMKVNTSKELQDFQDNLQLQDFPDNTDIAPDADIPSSSSSSDSSSIDIDAIPDKSSSSGGGSSSKSTSSEKENFKINQGKDSFSYLNSLKNADKDLYKPNKKIEYSKRCTNNEGGRMPIPVSTKKLKEIDKNDILMSAMKLNPNKDKVPLTHKEKKEYKSLELPEMIDKLNSDGIIYNVDLKSYSTHLEQKKSSDSTMINYICPKYWDISRKLPVHPRDIHNHLDRIVDLNFRGVTNKHILDRQGNTKTHDFWKDISDDNLKQDIITLIRTTSDDKIRLNNLSINDFYNEIYSDKYDIPNNELDLIYQKYTNRLEPRFINEKYNIDGYRFPCCFKNKGGQPQQQKQVDTSKIMLSNLTPCNINKFAHIHKKLQTLFQHDDNLQENLLGGFIKYGVKQDNNSIIYTLANLDEKYKNILDKLDIKQIKERILYNYTTFPYNSDKKDINKVIKDIGDKKEDLILYLLNNHMDYINEMIIPKLMDEHSLFLFLKLGEGNIVQLFKNEEYNPYDIIYFLDYIYNNKKQLNNINISNSHIEYINKSFAKFSDFLKKQNININNINNVTTDNAFNFVIGFNKIMNKTENKYNIKFIYDLIISKKNYIEYLKSKEKKDYKYIIPLVSEINNTNYIIFENIDEIINLKLQLNKYNISNPDCIFYFIYKINDIYEPIYYYNEKSNINGKKIECDLKYNLSSNKDINTYINNILSGINTSINTIYTKTYKDDLEFQQCIDEIYPKYKPKYLLVDNYCKISHIITENNCIFPIVPTNILKSYNDIDFQLIYDFHGKLPSYSDYIKYSNDEDIKNLKKYMKPNGLIVENDHVVNIVLENNSYIPIEPTKYNKSNMLNLPILGNTNIYTLDKYVQRFIPENDIRSKYNMNINYINHITSLTIQNIIFYLKKETILSEFYTDKPKLFTINSKYSFKIIKKDHDGKILNYIEKNNDFIDIYNEPNKLSGIVKDISQSKFNGLFKINININYLDIMNLISNDAILINFDKQQYLYDLINNFINDIVEILPNKKFKEYINNRDSSICFNNTEDICDYPCKYDENKCKLYVKETSIYENDNKLLINKITWKFVELYLIHKDIDVINNILQNNINISDLYKTKKSNEIFFNYLKYNNQFLNELFKYNSQFIRDINFYDKNNDTPISDNKPKNISSILNGIPNIIYKLFNSDATVWFYFGKNIDFLPLEHSFNNLFTGGGDIIDSITIKRKILTEIKIQKKNKEFLKNIKLYFDYGKSLNNFKDYISTDNYKITPFDLEILCNLSDDTIYPNIGFLLISSKYSKQSSSKLKHNIIFKYNIDKINNDTNIILLYHHLNSDSVYDLCSIVVKNIHNDDPYSYDTYMKFNDLYKIKHIKKVIDEDYPDILEKFNG